MKALILILLSAASLFAADDIRVFTIMKTNFSGSVTTREFFTRAGQTNLFRSTTTTNGLFTTRLCRFYHKGKLAAVHQAFPEGSLLVYTENGFSLTFHGYSNLLVDAYIVDKKGNVVDGFEGTNGIVRPMPASELRKHTTKPPKLRGAKPSGADEQWE